MTEENTYYRFSIETRIQHIILFTSFILLVITGFALKFSAAPWAQNVVRMLGGWEMRAHIHHISGIVMVAVGLYHIARYIYYQNKAFEMMLRWRDAQDFWAYIKYHIGVEKYPKYERFEWKNKIEYWGVAWGILLMGITGFLLMFPFVTLKFLPYAWYKIIILIHGYEALLATLTVFLWHFYNVHLNFEFPVQRSFITGRISEEMIKKEHTLEYERITSGMKK